jgi:hypothetical protein
MKRNSNYVLTIILDPTLQEIKDYLIYKCGYNLSTVVRNYMVKLYEQEKNKEQSSNIPY